MAPKRKATAPASAVESAPTPEAHGYEFGGPFGVALISFALPILCYAFAFLCNDVSGCPATSLLHPTALFTPPLLSRQSRWAYALDTLKRDVGWPGFSGLISTEAVLATAFWYTLSLALNALLPAQEVEGMKLTDGGKLKYRFNAFWSAMAILSVCAAGTFVQGPDFPLWPLINRNHVQLLTCNIIIAFVLATYCYLASFSVKSGNPSHRELAAGGHSGNMMYDWFIGRELNPRITIPYVGEIDIKSFMELRPGMLGWIVLDLAFMAKQYKSYGYVTDSMLIVTISQSIYVLDALYMEAAMLTTIDIVTDGLGFMLAFGDVAWLPFTYSLQARYLSVHPVALGPWYVLAILGVQFFGYYIFRASNNEKNMFRTNPDDPRVAHLTYIEMPTGSRLLTSGWWGTARHINYLGDWIMSWSYCLPTLAAGYKLTPSLMYPGSKLVTQGEAKGWGILVTYFYLLYFAILLIHRETRDRAKCRRKYGKDWEKYCKIVNSKILPGIY